MVFKSAALALIYRYGYYGLFLSLAMGILGLPFVQRFGHFLHLTPERLYTAQIWFDKYKGLSLIFGYFVPGFRHISAYMAGISKIKYITFLAFASVGAISWVITFISVGRYVGKDWEVIGELLHRYLWFFLGISIFAIGLLYWYKSLDKTSTGKG